MIQIIPAIDIIDGQCVRLTRGDYDTAKVYYRDPVDAAKFFADKGIARLHMVDLDGAKASAPRNLRTLEAVASRTPLSVQYGGGIKSDDSLRSVFDAGAARAICGSIAVREPEAFAQWLGAFGGERLILGADSRNGRVSVQGWTEDVPLGVNEVVAMFVPAGLKQAIVTDISKDGMLCGVDASFYRNLQDAFPGVEITVSGGISGMADIEALDKAQLRSVIVGKAIYEGHIKL